MKRKNLLFVSIISLSILVLGTINISESYSDVRLISTDNEGEEEDDQDMFSSLSRMLGENSGGDSGKDSGSKEKDKSGDSGKDSGSKEKDKSGDSKNEGKGTE
jgi:hypothetical protein